jgi:aquaporin Z
MPGAGTFPKVVAEFFGTFVMVFAGTGAIVINAVQGGVIGHVGISLTFGLVVMAMIYTIGKESGAHINPAVTIGFWAAGRFPSGQVPLYIAGQLSGAVAASLLLRLMFGLHATMGATLPTAGWGQAFGMEVILTMVLMFVILGVSHGARETGLMAGIAVGGTVALAALFAGPVSGASMNPARSLGPALAALHFEHLWLYLVATVLGALLAVPLSLLIHRKDGGQP